MKFLVDNALSPAVSEALQRAGRDSVRVRDYQMQAAEDEAILQRAARDGRVLVSADTDFSSILTLRLLNKPSVILFRRVSQRRPLAQAALLLANLPNLRSALGQGSIVVLEQTRVRVRPLGMNPRPARKRP